MTNAKTSALSPLCLVSGANTGIGFEVARGLAQQGARVVLASRDQSRGQVARDAIAQEFPQAKLELLVVDLSEQHSIRRAAKTFLASHDTLDVLINNAAVGLKERQESVDGIEMTFAVNVLGYFLLTELLLNVLRKASAARIINVSSRLAGGLDLSDVEFKRRPYDLTSAYSQSKQADRMLTWALARRLESTAVTANSMSPGIISTRLLRTFGPGIQGKSPTEGADTIVWLATSAEMAGVTNRFWAERKEVSCQFHNPEQEDALWRLCEEMTAGSAK